jgi:DNA modification methylase
LIQGDNLAVMTALHDSLAGRIDLIYVDPPFLTGKAYAARVGRGEDSRRPADWTTVEGYDDSWKDGASYLSMLYPRLKLMHDLLAPTGSLYLHLDWHASAYARILLDEIFGPDRLINEIIWVYHGPSPIRSAFNRKHDTLLVYAKSKDYTFNADAVRVPYNESTVRTFAASDKAGFGKKPDLARGKVPEDWWYFPVVARLHKERTGYPTQKPEALLERILLASSSEGDLVADFFCGSGTAIAAASRLGRRWIGVDRSALAIQTSYRRMLLSNLEASFELFTTHEDQQPTPLKPVFQVSTSQNSVRLIGLEGSQAPQAFPDNVVLWEIDGDPSGGAFHSQVRAARDWGEAALDDELALPEGSSSGKIAVRVLDSIGDVGVATS